MSSADTLVLAGSLGAVGFAVADDPDFSTAQRAQPGDKPVRQKPNEEDAAQCEAPRGEIKAG